MSFNRIQFYKSQKTAIRPQLHQNSQPSTSQNFPLNLPYQQNYPYCITNSESKSSRERRKKSSPNILQHSILDSNKLLNSIQQKQSLRSHIRIGNKTKKSLKQLRRQNISPQKILQMTKAQPKQAFVQESISKDLANFIVMAQQLNEKIKNNVQMLNYKHLIRIHEFRKKIKEQMRAYDQLITEIIEQESTKNTILLDSKRSNQSQ